MSKTIGTNAAFSRPTTICTDGSQVGLTKRELFAAMAMQGILAADDEPVPNLTDADFEQCKQGRYVKSGTIWVVANSDTPISLRLRMIKTGQQRRAEYAVACADDLIAALNAEKPDA